MRQPGLFSPSLFPPSDELFFLFYGGCPGGAFVISMMLLATFTDDSSPPFSGDAPLPLMSRDWLFFPPWSLAKFFIVPIRDGSDFDSGFLVI